jgi:two-component system, OmpR family, response regulator
LLQRAERGTQWIHSFFAEKRVLRCYPFTNIRSDHMDVQTQQPALTPPTLLIRADGEPLRILVADEDPLIAELFAIALRREGWIVTAAADGHAAVRTAEDNPPDLVVLETGLCDSDGVRVLQRLRSTRATLPVMVLSSQGAVEDRIESFALGADDFVAKPFHIEEIVLRLRALARRCGVGAEAGLIEIGDLSLNEYSHEVARGGRPVDLTATEFKVLRFLALNSRRVLSKTQILQEVWADFDGSTNVVEQYISYLRKKIDDGRSPMIRTVRGCGYMLTA